MNKNLLIIGVIGIIIVVTVAGGILFLNQQSSNDSITADNSGEVIMNDKMGSSDSEENMNHGSDHPDQIGNNVSSHHYLAYSNDAMSNTADGKRVLFFYANWCPTCRPVDAEIQANSDKIPEGTTIIRVNYNDTETDESEEDLARKYNITYQHTFVLIDENGNEVAKWNGGGLDEILSRI